MNELKVSIKKTELAIKEYQGQRVVTLKEIDAVHHRPDGTARKRFNDNKNHFIDGTDYFKVKCSEVRPFFGQTPPNGFNPDADIILITESGYLMLAKSFTDDLAWEVQRQLVNTYFRSTPEQRRQAAAFTQRAKREEVQDRNSRVREAYAWLKIAKYVPVPTYREVCAHYASFALARKEVLPLPEVREHTYTAEEVGKLLGGVSANMVGRLANQNGLKSPEYGTEVWDKSKYSSKQVPTWRYNEKAVARLRELLQ